MSQKKSLTFSQKDIDDAKSNISKIKTEITKADEDISEAYGDIEHLLDGQESLENYSRRNNIKVFGIPEKDTNNGSDPEVWEECEAAVKKEIHTKLVNAEIPSTILPMIQRSKVDLGLLWLSSSLGKIKIECESQQDQPSLMVYNF